MPAAEELSDQQLAIYITRLQMAGEDCRQQLQELKNVLQVQGATITDIVVEATTVKPKKWLLF